MLILQAERDSLLKPLQAVTGIVERRHTLPIPSNVLIEGKGGQTKLGNRFGNPNRHCGSRGRRGRLPHHHQCQEISGHFARAACRCAGVVDWDDSRLTLKAGKSRLPCRPCLPPIFRMMNVGEDISATFSLEQERFKPCCRKCSTAWRCRTSAIISTVC